MKVYVLEMEHRHGTNVSAYSTRENAMLAVIDYVELEWEGEAERWHLPPRENLAPDELVETYFDAVDDEDWTIHELEIDSDIPSINSR